MSAMRRVARPPSDLPHALPERLRFSDPVILNAPFRVVAARVRRPAAERTAHERIPHHPASSSAACSLLRLNCGLKRLCGDDRTSTTSSIPCPCSSLRNTSAGWVRMPDGKRGQFAMIHGNPLPDQRRGLTDAAEPGKVLQLVYPRPITSCCDHPSSLSAWRQETAITSIAAASRCSTASPAQRLFAPVAPQRPWSATTSCLFRLCDPAPSETQPAMTHTARVTDREPVSELLYRSACCSALCDLACWCVRRVFPGAWDPGAGRRRCRAGDQGAVWRWLS